MRRLMVALALAATLGLGAGGPAASAQVDPYGGYYGQGGGFYGQGSYGGGYGPASPGGWGYGGYYGPGYAPGGPVGPLSIPGPLPYGPYGAGGYGGIPGYGGVPYGTWNAYASPVLSGMYTQTGFPTFGLFPYIAANGNVANPSPYSSYQPYAFFMCCGSTYTGIN